MGSNGPVTLTGATQEHNSVCVNLHILLRPDSVIPKRELLGQPGLGRA